MKLTYVIAQDWQSGGEHSDEGDGHRADDCAGVPAAQGWELGAGRLDRLPPAEEGCRQLHTPPSEKVRQLLYQCKVTEVYPRKYSALPTFFNTEAPRALLDFESASSGFVVVVYAGSECIVQ